MSDTSYTCPSPPPVPSASADFRRHQRSGATFWGIMLVVLGAAFLAAQFAPAIAWWMLWPLVVMVAGIAQALTPGRDGLWTASRVLEGLGTVAIGAVLLGNTTGFVSWTVWLTFLTLWPVLVIALGISLVGQGVGLAWVRFVARLLVWATLGFAVYLSLTGAALGLIDRGSAVVQIPGVGANGTSVNISIEPGDGIPTIRTW